MRLAASAVLLAVLALAAQPARAGTQSCGWSGVAPRVPGDWSGTLPEGSNQHANVLLGEGGANYWQAWLIPIPRGGHIEFHGRFPHARYTSFTTYGEGLASIDAIHDAQIQPDPGSANPFVPGAHRGETAREYTVRLVERPPASGREPNTFYNLSPDGTKSGGSLARVSLRIYAPDRDQGPAGGVPLPDITLVSADGTRTKLPDCTDPGLPDVGLDAALAGAGSGEPLGVGTAIGAENPPEWRRFTNFFSSLVHRAGGDPQTTDEMFPYGGWGDTPDQRYISTLIDQAHGQVVAFRAKAPTFPRTRNGEPTMGSGQVRFWSFCSYGPHTGWYDCVQDDEVPVDEQGHFTIAISTAAARPRNAVDSCGVAWVPAGPSTQTTLILRNLLPDPSFAEAIHNAQPGTEAEVMRDHYPRGTYHRTTADFERRGCPPR
jgi:hypothetical protein